MRSWVSTRITHCLRFQIISDESLGCIFRSSSALLFWLPPFFPSFQQAAFPMSSSPFTKLTSCPLPHCPSSFILLSRNDEGCKVRKNCGSSLTQVSKSRLITPWETGWSESGRLLLSLLLIILSYNMVLDKGLILSRTDNRSGETIPKGNTWENT